ncbi:signal peptidase I [Candidatus Saccharibacteria bacterium]|nr:signal peptidase I [Candidatus Saccharibacteria bacterium]
MPASKKVRIFEGVGVGVLTLLLVLAAFKLPWFTGFSLRAMLAGIMMVFAIVVTMALKSFRVLPFEKRVLLKYMIVLGLLYVGIFYTIGAFTGYAVAVVQFGWKTLGSFILPIAVVIISTEIVRAKLLCFSDRFSKIAAYVIGVLAEIVIYVAVYDTARLEQLLLLVGLVGAAFTGNFLYNYVSVRFGAIPVVAYRLIIGLYAYIIPILPDIYEFFASFCKMVMPVFVYWVIERTFVKHDAMALEKKTTIPTRILEVVSCIVMVGFIGLVSCQFDVGAIVVGSESMTGAIDMGDVVMMKKYYTNEEVKEGEIIVFNRKNERVIHRVIKVSTVAGKKRYYTKGDTNEHEDDGFVTDEDLVGKVIIKVPAIGWPTLWLKKVFEI